ncbi:TY-Chap domain-containing protein [Williamsia sp. SKLECPSW1]
MTASTRFDTALEDSWLTFRTGLADLLVDVTVDEEIVVRRSHDAGDPWAPLLSFVVTGARRVRCTILASGVTVDQVAVLRGDGWRVLRDGRVIREHGRRRVDEVCAAATDVLREMCDVLHPAFLAPIDTGADTGTTTSTPREIVPTASSQAVPVADTEHLQELLLDTLAGHADDAFVDAGGDIRVQMGTQTIQLRVHPTRPVVEFVACVAAVLVDDRTVNEIVIAEGSRWTGVAVHVLDGHVWATQRLVVPTFVAANVIAAIESWRDFLRDGAPAITARIVHAADPVGQGRVHEPSPDHVEKLLDTLTALTTPGAPLPSAGVARLCEENAVVARRCLITGARRLLIIGSAKRQAADGGDLDAATRLEHDRQLCRTMLMSVSGAVDLLRERDSQSSSRHPGGSAR